MKRPLVVLALCSAVLLHAQSPDGTPFRIERLDPALDTIVDANAQLETLGVDRASFRRILEPLLEAAVRVGPGARADRVRRGRPAAGVGIRYHEHRAARDAGHRHAREGGIRGGPCAAAA